jgi:hypothetical protein
VVEAFLRRILSLVMVIGWAAIAVAQLSPNDEVRFAAVKHYWEWSSYFGVDGVDFPGARYQPGMSFHALVFVDTDLLDSAASNSGDGSPAYWGFCSTELGVCQSYVAYADGAVNYANSIKILPRETVETAFTRFEMAEFSNAASIAPIPSQPSSQGGGSVAVLSQPRPPEVFNVRTIQRTITLPTLGLPVAVRQKLSNSTAERAVKEMLYRPGSNSGCTISVPYADEHLAAIPVLVDCRTKRTINVASRGPEGTWYFSHNGFIEDPSIVSRLAPRIERNASLKLKE